LRGEIETVLLRAYTQKSR